MRRWLFLMVAVVAMSGSSLAQEADVVHLKDGTTMAGQIEVITDDFVDVRTTVSIGGGKMASAKRQFKMAQVDYIDFAPLPGEVEALEKPDPPGTQALAELWKQRRMHVHRPNSTAGQLGLLVAQEYLKSDSDYDFKLALDLYVTLENEAWKDETRNAAREGRLRALIALKRLDEAMAEARKLAAESEDSRMLIEAKFVLARADFEKLKQLVEDNPKWLEDDIVRPEIEALYHSTADQFLFPYLFHGTESESAARGLMSAASVYSLFEKFTLANACAEDVIALYSQTSHAEQAKKLLGPGQ